MDFHQLAHDFGQRYVNSYVFFQRTQDEEPELVYIKQIQEDHESGGFPLVSFSSIELGSNVVRYDTDSTFQFIRPECGLFQFERDAYLCTRSTQQGYSKGVNTKTYSLSPVHARYTGHGVTGNAWERCLRAAYKRKYFTWASAITELKKSKGATSCALSPRYAIALSVQGDGFDIYHYNYIIGKASSDGNLSFNPEENGAYGLQKLIKSAPF